MWFLQARCGLRFKIISHNQMLTSEIDHRDDTYLSYEVSITEGKCYSGQSVRLPNHDINRVTLAGLTHFVLKFTFLWDVKNVGLEPSWCSASLLLSSFCIPSKGRN